MCICLKYASFKELTELTMEDGLTLEKLTYWKVFKYYSIYPIKTCWDVEGKVLFGRNYEFK